MLTDERLLEIVKGLANNGPDRTCQGCGFGGKVRKKHYPGDAEGRHRCWVLRYLEARGAVAEPTGGAVR